MGRAFSPTGAGGENLQGACRLHRALGGGQCEGGFAQCRVFVAAEHFGKAHPERRKCSAAMRSRSKRNGSLASVAARK